MRSFPPWLGCQQIRPDRCRQVPPRLSGRPRSGRFGQSRLHRLQIPHLCIEMSLPKSPLQVRRRDTQPLPASCLVLLDVCVHSSLEREPRSPTRRGGKGSPAVIAAYVLRRISPASYTSPTADKLQQNPSRLHPILASPVSGQMGVVHDKAEVLFWVCSSSRRRGQRRRFQDSRTAGRAGKHQSARGGRGGL